MYTVTMIRKYRETVQVSAYSVESAVEAAKREEDPHAELLDEEVDSISYQSDEPEYEAEEDK